MIKNILTLQWSILREVGKMVRKMNLKINTCRLPGYFSKSPLPLTLKSGIMKLQHQIIMARQQKGFTQEELATLTGLSIRTIQRIESGESIPRSFTLKAIAKALDQPYEQLMRNETEVFPTQASGKNEPVRHFLQLFNLSCFFYIVVPWVHFLIPYYLLKKQHNLGKQSIQRGRKIIRQQVYWIISLHLLLLLTLAYNLIQVSIFNNRQYVIHYLWPFFIMYFLNAGIIINNGARIRKEFQCIDSQLLS
jgi:XRE family transcriptional regulator, regulator of sulfur utilization